MDHKAELNNIKTKIDASIVRLRQLLEQLGSGTPSSDLRRRVIDTLLILSECRGVVSALVDGLHTEEGELEVPT